MYLRGKKWVFSSAQEQARILVDVVTRQLEMIEELLEGIDEDKGQARKRALQFERHIEDCLLEHDVELLR